MALDEGEVPSRLILYGGQEPVQIMGQVPEDPNSTEHHHNIGHAGDGHIDPYAVGGQDSIGSIDILVTYVQ